MCSIKPPKPEPIKIQQPQYMRNPYLDDTRDAETAYSAGRVGRSTLRIPLGNGKGVGFSGRGGRQGTSATAGPRGNARNPSQNGPASRTPVPKIGAPGRGRPRPGGGGGSLPPGHTLQIF